MTDHWGFVVAAYALAVVVLGGYWRRLVRKEREVMALRDDRARALLLQTLEKNADQDAFLRHGAVMGLFELGAPEKLKGQLSNPSVAVRRGILLALRRFGLSSNWLSTRCRNPRAPLPCCGVTLPAWSLIY